LWAVIRGKEDRQAFQLLNRSKRRKSSKLKKLGDPESGKSERERKRTEYAHGRAAAHRARKVLGLKIMKRA